MEEKQYNEVNKFTKEVIRTVLITDEQAKEMNTYEDGYGKYIYEPVEKEKKAGRPAKD